MKLNYFCGERSHMLNIHFRFCVLLAFLLGLQTWVRAAEDAMLSIRTESGTRLVVSITYFEGGQPTRASIQGITADAETELKLGLVEGIEVQVGTTQPSDVQLELLAGSRVVAAASGGGKNTRLKFGSVAADWNPPPIDVSPNAVDKAVWSGWREFLASADLRAFRIAQASVPEAAEAIAFDIPSLKSFLSCAKAELGGVVKGGNAESAELIAWDLSGGQRVVAATLPFERGSVTFEVTHIGNAITDIRFESPQLDGIWFAGPSELTPYESTADALLTDLFRGDALQAWQRFGPDFRGVVSVEQLSGLSESLKSQFGKLDSIETKFTRLLPVDFDRYQQTLVIVSALKAGSKRCLAETKFVFDVSPSSVPSGQLASVFVRPTWATAQPLHQQAAINLLVTVFEAGELHTPEALSSGLVDQDLLAERFAEICAVVGTNATVDMDLWRTSGTETYTRADGALELAADESADLRLDFVGEEVMGVTLITPRRAVSTLSCVSDPEEFTTVAEKFWTALLSDETEAAYELLGPQMRKKHTIDVLRFTVATSGFTAANLLETSSVRLSTHPDRLSPSSVSVYTVATLGDGTKHPLRCDLLRSDGTIKVIGFETDIQEYFPVATNVATEQLVRRFISGNVGAVADMVAQEQRIELDREVLEHFLRKLNTELGDWSVDPTLRLIHRYAAGSRQEVLSGRLVRGEQQVPYQVQTRLGNLQSFNFQHEPLRNFLPEEFVKSSVRQRAVVFVGAWFASPVQRDDLLRKVLDQELAQEASLDEFGSLRKYLLRRYGAFKDIVVDGVTSDVGDQTAVAVCRIVAANEDYKLQLTFTWNATSIRISGVEVIR
ncbi:MAG: hypothetical protein Aurels2KO_36190 [Aureliella sp.]